MGKPFKFNKTRNVKWVFTIHFYKERLSDWNSWMAKLDEGLFPWEDESVRFLAMAEEISDGGTPHLQGYIHFNRSVRGAHVAKLLEWENSKCFIEPAKSSQAWKYPGKEDKKGSTEKVWHIGDRAFMEKNTSGGPTKTEIRLNNLKDMIDSGASLNDLWQADFYSMVRYNSGVTLYYRMQRGIDKDFVQRERNTEAESLFNEETFREAVLRAVKVREVELDTRHKS